VIGGEAGWSDESAAASVRSLRGHCRAPINYALARSQASDTVLWRFDHHRESNRNPIFNCANLCMQLLFYCNVPVVVHFI